jgi:hypothetical protein
LFKFSYEMREVDQLAQNKTQHEKSREKRSVKMKILNKFFLKPCH